MLRWAFAHLQAPDGGSVYLRLTTRQIAQPERAMTPELAAAVLAGGYWLMRRNQVPSWRSPAPVRCAGSAQGPGAVREDVPAAGLLHVTSADRLYADWRRRGSGATAATLLAPLATEPRS